MDEDTANLIFSLQLEDLQSMTADWKGKAIEGRALADYHTAAELQREEILIQKRIIADLRMARSISHAVQDDGAMIAILTGEELRSAQDRETACRMSGQTNHDVPNLLNCRVDEDIVSKFGSLNIEQTDHEDDYEEVEGSSSWFAGQIRGKGNSSTKNECIACTEVRNTIQAPCQHHYCRKCIMTLVSDSIVDISLFPPRCCGQEMPMSLIRPCITVELEAKFELAAIEHGTVNRTYCYSCGIFLTPDSIQGYQAHCTVCDLSTCTFCNCRSHLGDCPKDPALEAVLQLANEMGWQRCTNCEAVVERREGCNHMK